MLRNLLSSDQVFRRFFQKKLLFYMLPNIFFNTCVPYFTFKNMSAVYLFQGEFCFARFLLPMAFFLPFIITFDILKKTAVLVGQGKTVLALPGEVYTNKFLFKMAVVNGMVTLAAVGLVSFSFQLLMQSENGFDGTVLSVIMGSLAGLLTVLFTVLPLRRVVSVPDLSRL